MSGPVYNVALVFVLAYLVPAAILWAHLLHDTHRGRVKECDFVERAMCATWPLVNLGHLVTLAFRLLFRALKPE